MSDQVKATALVSFNGLYAGDSGMCDDNAQLRAWESAGLVAVERPAPVRKAVRRAKDPSRPGAAQPDDPGSEQI